MRFLVDRCGGVRLSHWLAAQGHDVVDSGSWAEDPGDRAILELAAKESRILITLDHDFGQLVFGDDRPHCGLIRLPDCPADQRIAILTDLIARHEGDMNSGAVITVRGDRIRISRTQPKGR